MQAKPYFGESVAFAEDAIAKQWKDPQVAARLLRAARARLADSPSWVVAELESGLRELAVAEGVGAGKLMQPLRVALTGTDVSPGIGDVLELLGRERSLARIDAALAHPRLTS